jgi:predicted N-acetyltransferase YhbS
VSDDVLESGPLTDEDELGTFACGVESLDLWLVDHARRAQRSGTARTTVWRRPGERVVVGYYALCPTEVHRSSAGLTRRWSSGAGIVPGFLLARLALDKALHGQGLGEQLLVDALETVCAAADIAGGRVVVVDPVDDSAAQFYARYGFESVGGSSRQYLLIQDVRGSLGLG